MTEDTNERTETDERVAENRAGVPIRTITGNVEDSDPSTGLPRGTHDDDSSPLDRGEPLGGKAPSERINEPIEE